MKIVKINDNILINVEQVYALEKYNNQNEINKWEDQYNDAIEDYYKDPPELMLSGGIWYKPNFEVEEKNKKILEEYLSLLNNMAIASIGDKPKFYETYKLILSTGLKISIDKEIYDKLYKYLLKFIKEK